MKDIVDTVNENKNKAMQSIIDWLIRRSKRKMA
jgi:hypothetical protein